MKTLILTLLLIAPITSVFGVDCGAVACLTSEQAFDIGFEDLAAEDTDSDFNDLYVEGTISYEYQNSDGELGEALVVVKVVPMAAGNMDGVRIELDPAYHGKCSLEEGTEGSPVSTILDAGNPVIYSDKVSMFELGCDTTGPVNTEGSFECIGVDKILVCENIALGYHGEGGGFLASKLFVYKNTTKNLSFDHFSTELGYSTRGILPAQSPIPNERNHIVDALNLNAPGSATENCDPRNGALDGSCKEKIREALLNYSSPAGAKATKRPANRAPQQIKFQVAGSDVSLDSWFDNQRGNPNRNKGRCMFIDCATPEEGGGSYSGASPGQACISTSDCETNSICLDSGSGLKCYNNNLADSNSRIDFDICDLNRVCQDGYSCSPVGATEYNACVGSIGGIGGDPGGDPEPTPGFLATHCNHSDQATCSAAEDSEGEKVCLWDAGACKAPFIMKVEPFRTSDKTDNLLVTIPLTATTWGGPSYPDGHLGSGKIDWGDGTVVEFDHNDLATQSGGEPCYKCLFHRYDANAYAAGDLATIKIYKRTAADSVPAIGFAYSKANELNQSTGGVAGTTPGEVARSLVQFGEIGLEDVSRLFVGTGYNSLGGSTIIDGVTYYNNNNYMDRISSGIFDNVSQLKGIQFASQARGFGSDAYVDLSTVSDVGSWYQAFSSGARWSSIDIRNFKYEKDDGTDINNFNNLFLNYGRYHANVPKVPVDIFVGNVSPLLDNSNPYGKGWFGDLSILADERAGDVNVYCDGVTAGTLLWINNSSDGLWDTGLASYDSVACQTTP